MITVNRSADKPPTITIDNVRIGQRNTMGMEQPKLAWIRGNAYNLGSSESIL